MKVAIIAIVCLATVGQLVSARHSILSQWEQYKRQFGKLYEPEEDAARFALFMRAREQIQKHNMRNEHYKKDLNHLSDWTEEEFNKLNGLRFESELLAESDGNSPQAQAFLQAILDDARPVPEEVDWRKVPNRVTPVKNQYHCGSCWAFATTGLLEGQQVVRNFTEELVPLSEQDLVDCSTQDHGCQGGLMTLALQDIATMGGIESERVYPYVAPVEEKCKFSRSKVVMTVKDSAVLPNGDEQTLKMVVAKFGPVSTGVMATQNWRDYKSGMLHDETCDNDSMNHGVLIVGYGTDPDEGDFWIVKNSWGSIWGEEGYFRIKRGVNKCSLGKFSAIPVF